MILYCATNIINLKKYFGITNGTLELRIRYHYRDAFLHRSNGYFQKALNKYGKEGFKWEIIYESWDDDYKDLGECEKLLIQTNGTYIRNFGYNSTLGGTDCKLNLEVKQKRSDTTRKLMTPEMKKKISDSMKKAMTPECKKRISDSMKKNMTLERKKRLSDIAKQYMACEKGKKMSEERRKNISEALYKHYAKNKMTSEHKNKLSEKSKAYYERKKKRK